MSQKHRRERGAVTTTSPLRRNIASLMVLQGISYLAPLITLPYLVRVLGPAKFGLLAFAQATIQYFVILAEYGFNLSATRQVAIHRADPQQLGRIFWSTLAIKLLLATVGLLVLGALLSGVERFHSDWPVYLITFLMVLGYALLPGWYLQGREKMRAVTVMHAGATLLSVAGIFLFVHEESDYLLAAAIQAGTLVLAAAIGLVMVWRTAPVPWQLPDLHGLRTALREGWEVFQATLATSLYTSSNVFVLGLFAGNTVVGYFSAADKIARAAQGMFSPITQAMYPRINALAAGSRATALQFVQRGLRWLAAGTALASLALFVLADPVVPWLLGERFRESVELVRVMALLPLLLTLSHVFGIQVLLSFGFRREYRRVVVIAGVANIALLVPMTWGFGSTGTAITVVLCEAGLLTGMWLMLRHQGLDPWRGRIRNSAEPT